MEPIKTKKNTIIMSFSQQKTTKTLGEKEQPSAPPKLGF
jgi:hypothetical protein